MWTCLAWATVRSLYSGPEEAGSSIIPSVGKADIVIRPHLLAVADDAV